LLLVFGPLESKGYAIAIIIISFVLTLVETGASDEYGYLSNVMDFD
jgi:hypothetical protein